MVKGEKEGEKSLSEKVRDGEREREIRTKKKLVI